MISKNESGKIKQSIKQKLKAKGYSTIEIPYDDKRGKTAFSYYAYNRNELLGKGAFGTVFKAYPLDPKTGVLNTSKTYAVKICSNNLNPAEFRIFSRYYRCEQPIIKKGKVYFVSEFFEGIDLFDSNNKLNPEFIDLPLGLALEIIQQLMMSVNLIHHATPQTGAAISHADIKGQNIKVYIDPKTGKVHVTLLDFGLSNEVEDNPEAIYQYQNCVGTPYFVPLEAVYNQRGLKSDIYALVPIIIAILGGKPFTRKDYEFEDHNYGKKDIEFPEKYFKAPYTYTSMLNKQFFELSLFPFNVKDLIIKFLTRMQMEYGSRPDSDETLKFFTTLNYCYKLQQEIIAPSDSDKGYMHHSVQACRATMILLSLDLWDKQLYRKKLEDYPELIEDIVYLYDVGDLNKDSFRELIAQYEEAEEEIETIDVEKLEFGVLLDEWVICDYSDKGSTSTENTLRFRTKTNAPDKKDKGKEKEIDETRINSRQSTSCSSSFFKSVEISAVKTHCEASDEYQARSLSQDL